MTLRELVEELEEIAKRHGDDLIVFACEQRVSTARISGTPEVMVRQDGMFAAARALVVKLDAKESDE